MTRFITLLGYGVIAAGAIGLEVMARRTGRVATFRQLLDFMLRRLPVRLLLLAAWLWLGWHVFVRVDWR